MSDLISRQAAIDALYKMLHDCFWADDEELDAVITTLNELPSAQPDLCDGCDRYGASCVGEGCGKLEMPEVAKDTNVPINDCISRQMAIDALDVLCQEHRYRIPGKRETYSEYNEAWQDALDRVEGAIGNLPSAQPEPKWIPCVDGNEPKANAECWISTSAKYVRRASYAPKANNQPNGFIVTDGGFGFYEYGKSAKAWMPYTKEPEPYREDGKQNG